MSDIILVRKNTSNQWIAETKIDHMEHKDALTYVRNFPEYDGRFGNIWGMTLDEFVPIDDSQDYIGWDEETESVVFVMSNPDCYQTYQKLEVAFLDDNDEPYYEVVYDNNGNEIYGILEDWKHDE